MAYAVYIQDGEYIDYTPTSAVAAGDVVVQGEMVGVARTPIAANALGSLAIVGVFEFAKANPDATLAAVATSGCTPRPSCARQPTSTGILRNGLSRSVPQNLTRTHTSTAKGKASA